jgi:dipeptidyl aminopeptidase/acylaminoacyl peptidase
MRALLAAVFLLSMAQGQAAPSSFEVSDYFRIGRITELDISSDGELVAYVVETPSLDEDRSVRQAFVRDLARGTDARRVVAADDGAQLSWIPSSHRLAFTASRNGVSQVYTYDLQTAEAKQLTHSRDPVEQFRYSQDGHALAYTSRATPDPGHSLHARLSNAQTAIRMDVQSTNLYDFVDPNAGAYEANPARLWISLLSGEPFEAESVGDVQSMHWSPSGRFLSLTYISADLPESVFRHYRTSVGVIDVQSRQFSALAKGKPAIGAAPGLFFAGGEWVPKRDTMMIRRIVDAHPWLADWGFPSWAFVDVPVQGRMHLDDADWRPVEMYLGGGEFVPANDHTVLMETKLRGRNSLYEVTARGQGPSKRLAGVDGSSSLFRFSSDLAQAVFVNESLTRPPEIYRWSRKSGVEQISHINASFDQVMKPRTREFEWQSRDGTTAHGWLLEPQSEGTRPWPLITFVHGGPSFVFPDAFAPYFRTWPYPLDVFATHGMAVFIPNYRGTSSYGRKYASPARIDGEPIDDIVSGIQHLIDTGIADPERLGISGQSHGAWLGPMVMACVKVFRAGSFAENISNQTVAFELMDLRANREIHEPVLGTSLYESPRRFDELSPDLQFRGMVTSTLFEAGAQSLALGMLGYAKAAERLALPNEFYVYPRTGHVITSPRLQRESAERNLDWFRFWLKNEEPRDPGRVREYERWKSSGRGAAIRMRFSDGTSFNAARTLQCQRPALN